MHIHLRHAFALAAASALAVAACDRSPSAGSAPGPGASGPSNPAGSGASAAAPAPPTNRIDVPAPVRQNLGITFATAERRAVAETIRIPGRFELLPQARHEYRTMLPGQVEPLVAQYETVEAGQPLYRLRSPRWRELQQEISEAEAAVGAARASTETIGPLREAHRAHEEALKESVALWEQRIEQLERVRSAVGGKADELAAARASLAAAKAELAEVLEKDAELEARQRQAEAALAAARARFDLLLASASTLLGTTAEELATSATEGGLPRWRTIDLVEVRAVSPGVVESVALNSGGWAEDTSLVLATVEPTRLRFRARGLQSDLPRFRDGMPALIVPAGGGAAALQDTMSGTLAVGLGADPHDRTIDLLVVPEELRPWARPGVSAYLEVAGAGGTEEIAIPRSAVVRDGAQAVFFRRNPSNPDQVIRVDADLGADDGRWIVVKSGLREGDQVVVDGAYQLMLASSAGTPRGGHFHADGTFHEGEH